YTPPFRSHRVLSSLCEAPELEPHREHDKLLRVTKWLLVDLGVFLPLPRVPAHTSPKTQGPVSSVGGNGTLKNNRNFPGAFSIENAPGKFRSEEHTSELQSRFDLVCRPLPEKKNINSYKSE